LLCTAQTAVVHTVNIGKDPILILQHGYFTLYPSSVWRLRHI
jgi:hypothetical protein